MAENLLPVTRAVRAQSLQRARNRGPAPYSSAAHQHHTSSIRRRRNQIKAEVSAVCRTASTGSP